MNFLRAEQIWEIIRAQHGFTCGKCGHTLDRPRIERGGVVCEKCGATAVRLEEA
jgi:ribosomal protein L37AE/L43A